jgi:hypothetical protein
MVWCMGPACTFSECVNAPCHAGVVAKDLYDVRATLLDLSARYERDPGNVAIQQEVGATYLRLQQLDSDRRRLAAAAGQGR